ncbi:MAG: PAN domain-containing protein [Xenococcaceae cyanobacterium MO_188.B29]|nr:PAN domain-containing protein [Xenococcaceae cyanobacterium MO_188.B29]
MNSTQALDNSSQALANKEIKIKPPNNGGGSGGGSRDGSRGDSSPGDGGFHPEPPRPPTVTVEFDTDRMGLDLPYSYRTDSWESCKETCTNNSECRAFTFVPRKYYPDGIGKCWLKYGVPAPIPNRPGMISGVKQ